MPRYSMSVKKRIIFVDDEPMVLNGLRRMLHSQHAQWDMTFVESGQKALEWMAKETFDVIISDMQMPGMNGAELFSEVMRLHPKTVRIILSGHADQALIMKCIGSTHQYLSKPCDPAALKAVVIRATQLEGSLENDHLRKLVSQMQRLPSIPALYSEMVEKLQNPQTSIEEIGELVARDIGMTAEVLKLVNSSYFGLSQQVSHPVEAVKHLGLDTIKSLVLSIHAVSQFEVINLPNFSTEALWKHSLHTGICARQIAHEEKCETKLANEAFVAGMLHDVGRMVMAVNLPEQWQSAVKLAQNDGIEVWVAEKKIFGASHSDVGGYLLGLWGLPVPVVEAIALHHEPSLSVEKKFNPLTAVHVANVIMRESADPLEKASPPMLDTAYLDALGLAARVPTWRTVCQNTLTEHKTL